jgi:hypothetical protein
MFNQDSFPPSTSLPIAGAESTYEGWDVGSLVDISEGMKMALARTLTKRGGSLTIVLPKQVLDTMGWAEGDTIEVEQAGTDRLLLKRAERAGR